MPLTTETKVVARCDDGCNAVRFGTEDQPPIGLYATVEEVWEDSNGVVRSRIIKVYATTLAHLKRAAETAFLDDQQQTEQIYGPGKLTQRPEHESAGERAETAPAA